MQGVDTGAAVDQRARHRERAIEKAVIATQQQHLIAGRQRAVDGVGAVASVDDVLARAERDGVVEGRAGDGVGAIAGIDDDTLRSGSDVDNVVTAASHHRSGTRHAGHGQGAGRGDAADVLKIGVSAGQGAVIVGPRKAEGLRRRAAHDQSVGARATIDRHRDGGGRQGDAVIAGVEQHAIVHRQIAANEVIAAAAANVVYARTERNGVRAGTADNGVAACTGIDGDRASSGGDVDDVVSCAAGDRGSAGDTGESDDANGGSGRQILKAGETRVAGEINRHRSTAVEQGVGVGAAARDAGRVSGKSRGVVTGTEIDDITGANRAIQTITAAASGDIVGAGAERDGVETATSRNHAARRIGGNRQILIPRAAVEILEVLPGSTGQCAAGDHIGIGGGRQVDGQRDAGRRRRQFVGIQHQGVNASTGIDARDHVAKGDAVGARVGADAGGAGTQADGQAGGRAGAIEILEMGQRGGRARGLIVSGAKIEFSGRCKWCQQGIKAIASIDRDIDVAEARAVIAFSKDDAVAEGPCTADGVVAVTGIDRVDTRTERDRIDTGTGFDTAASAGGDDRHCAAGVCRVEIFKAAVGNARRTAGHLLTGLRQIYAQGIGAHYQQGVIATAAGDAGAACHGLEQEHVITATGKRDGVTIGELEAEALLPRQIAVGVADRYLHGEGAEVAGARRKAEIGQGGGELALATLKQILSLAGAEQLHVAGGGRQVVQRARRRIDADQYRDGAAASHDHVDQIKGGRAELFGGVQIGQCRRGHYRASPISLQTAKCRCDYPQAEMAAGRTCRLNWWQARATPSLRRCRPASGVLRKFFARYHTRARTRQAWQNNGSPQLAIPWVCPCTQS